MTGSYVKKVLRTRLFWYVLVLVSGLYYAHYVTVHESEKYSTEKIPIADVVMHEGNNYSLLAMEPGSVKATPLDIQLSTRNVHVSFDVPEGQSSFAEIISLRDYPNEIRGLNLHLHPHPHGQSRSIHDPDGA